MWIYCTRNLLIYRNVFFYIIHLIDEMKRNGYLNGVEVRMTCIGLTFTETFVWQYVWKERRFTLLHTGGIWMERKGKPHKESVIFVVICLGSSLIKLDSNLLAFLNFRENHLSNNRTLFSVHLASFGWIEMKVIYVGAGDEKKTADKGQYLCEFDCLLSSRCHRLHCNRFRFH